MWKAHKKEMNSKAALPLPVVGFFPLAQAAVWAGVSKKTLQRMIHRGLPSHQTGPRGKILLKLSDIDEFTKRPKLDLDRMVDEVCHELNSKGTPSS